MLQINNVVTCDKNQNKKLNKICSNDISNVK